MMLKILTSQNKEDMYYSTESRGQFSKTYRGYPRGVIVKAIVYEIVAREFELQSRYYVHFRTNTLGKGMNPLISPAMG